MSLHSIANFQIMFTAILFSAVIVVLDSLKNRNKGLYFSENFKISLTAIHIAFQFFLILEIEPYRVICIDYFCMYLLGVNVHLRLNIEKLNCNYSHLFFAPLYGFAISTILGCYLIGFNCDLDYFLPVLSGIVLVLTLLNLRLIKQNFVFKLDRPVWIRLNLRWFFISMLVLILIYPIIGNGFLTSPYRFGPDIASYVKQTNYLLNGGTFEQSLQTLQLYDGMSVKEINKYSDAIMAWPFAYFFRWGFLAYEIIVCKLNFSINSYETIFVSLVLPFILFGGICIVWISSYIKTSSSLSLLLFLAFVFNANFINLMYEGFYANSFVLMFFSYLMFLFLTVRTRLDIVNRDYLILSVPATIIVAACLTIYPECIFFIFIPFLFIFSVVDYFLDRKFWKFQDVRPYFFVISIILVSIFIIYPAGYLEKWFQLAIRQLLESGGNGYPQPYWALPHEIFGISSIYLNQTASVIGTVLHRSGANLLFGTLTTLAFIFGLFFSFKLLHLRYRLGIVTAVSMIGISIFFAVLKSWGNNYSYMKMYIFMTPILLTYFFMGLQDFYSYYSNMAFKLAITFILSCITLNGLIYIYQYKTQENLIPQSLLNISQNPAFQIPPDSIIYPIFIDQRGEISNILHRVMFAAISDSPWIIEGQWNADENATTGFFHKFTRRKLYLFVEKDDSKKYHANSGQVLLDTNDYLLINSNMLLEDFIMEDNFHYDFNQIRSLVNIQAK